MKTPRDRQGAFDPKLVVKRQTRLAPLNDGGLDLYGGGMSVRDIASQLQRLYRVAIGRDTISRVTDRCWKTSPCGSSGRYWARAVTSALSRRRSHS